MNSCEILIIGAGSIGRRHIHNFKQLGSSVSVFSYRNATANSTRVDAANDFPLISNLSAGIEVSDAVVVANRTDQHLDVALEAAKQKKHLLIEKPLAASMLGVRELERVVTENGLVVETGFMLRFHPNLLWIREFLNEGRLGRVQYARASVGQYLPDWRPGTDHRCGYGARRKWGGGVVLDLIHEIDLIAFLFGEIKDVVAMLAYTPELEIETESIAQLGMRLRSGILAQVHLDYLRPCYGRSTEIIGEKGVVTWDYVSGTVTLDERGSPARVVHKVPEGFQRNDMYMSEAKHFLDSISGKNAGVAATLKDAEHALRVAFAAHISSEQRTFVSPDEVGDDWCGANGG